MKTTAYKILADGTPYTVVREENEKGVVHHLELNPPVTIANVRVLTVRGRLGRAVVQHIAEAFDTGFQMGYLEGAHELTDESQRVYIENEDFTTQHKRAHN